MQPLTAPPRDHLTVEQVEASLAWQHSTKLRWGVDLLNSQLEPTGLDVDVTDAAVSWQWRAQPVDGQAPVSAQVRRQGSLRYRHQAEFNPLAVLYRPWVEMLSRPTSLFFDGVDDQVSVPNTGGLLAPTQQTTWEIRFKVGDTPDAFDTLMGFLGNDWDMRMDSMTGIQCHTWDSLSQQPFISPAFPSGFDDGEWHHLAIVWDGVAGVRRARIDGVEVYTATHTMTPGVSMPRDHTATPTFWIGNVNSTRHFNGWIDEVRIWSTARTDTEVDANATAVLTGAEPGLRANWRFNDGSGTTLTDYGPNGLHGTISGAQWDDAEWVRWHLGVFTAVMPPFEYDGHSDEDGPLVWRPLELADRSHFWQSDETPDPVTVAVGTDIVQYIQDDLGVRFNELDVSGVSNGGTLATQDYVFDAGTPWLEVYNTLLAAIGNEPLHADADGLPRSQPLVDPEQQPAEHDYAFATTVVPQARVEAVNPELPNTVRFVARRSEDLAEEGDMIRTVVNESTGPASRQQRGGRTILVRVEVDAQTQEDLDAQARALAPFYFAGGGLRYTGQVGLNPRHDDSDVVFLERPALGIAGNWLVTGWSIRLGTADQMRVMDLVLEQLTGAAFLSVLPTAVGAFGTYSFGSHPFGGPL